MVILRRSGMASERHLQLPQLTPAATMVLATGLLCRSTVFCIATSNLRLWPCRPARAPTAGQAAGHGHGIAAAGTCSTDYCGNRPLIGGLKGVSYAALGRTGPLAPWPPGHAVAPARTRTATLCAQTASPALHTWAWTTARTSRQRFTSHTGRARWTTPRPSRPVAPARTAWRGSCCTAGAPLETTSASPSTQ